MLVAAQQAHQATAEAEAAAAVGGGAGIADDNNAAMEESDDDDEGMQVRKKREAEDRERKLRAIQASSVNTVGPMKIRTDCVPKHNSLLLKYGALH